jgi:hypothetical protein
MRALMALIAVAMIGSACTTIENLKPAERGDFLALKDISYERVWRAANTVMARNFRIVDSDAEIGEVTGISGPIWKNAKGQEHVWDYMFWRQSVALFIWPTESNDLGYTINIDTMPGPPLSVVNSLSIPVDPYLDKDWRKLFLKALKKELDAS